ncbi:MAG: IMP dehydrogenase, partial [Treponema sp.]|nr:IMP dehydrogenase [Treponema sp.]
MFTEGLSYDDVLLLPGYSETLPKDCDIKTTLCNGISLNLPVISAAMDTVTEEKLAIAIALEGGTGVIHRNLNPGEQARQVAAVKRYLNWIIDSPVTVPEDALMRDIYDLTKKHGVSGLPVVDKDGKLKGIITSRDLRFRHEETLPVVEIMTTKMTTVRGEPKVAEALEIFRKNRIEKLPVVDGEGRLTGLITLKDIEKKESYPR